MEPRNAAGFGEAMAALLAQGGSMRTDKRGTRFLGGRLRGKTLDQGVEMAKGMWAGASDAVKEKYAQRAGMGRFAPSEVMERPGAVNQAADKADATKSTTKDKAVGAKAAMTENSPEAPPETSLPSEVEGSDMSEAALGTPEQQGMVAEMLREGEEMAMAAGGSMGGSNDFMGNAAHKMMRETERQTPPAPRQTSPLGPPMTVDGKPIFAPGLNPASVRPVDAAAQPQPAAAPDAFATVPQVPAGDPSRPAAPQSQPASSAGPRINPLTGLPMGYVPGDALPDNATPAMRTAQSESNARMAAAPQLRREAPAPAPARMSPAEMAAEAAIRPGAQARIASDRINSGRAGDGYKPRGLMEGIRRQMGAEQGYRQREAERLTMDEVEGLGPMAAWGVNPRTGRQLTRADLAGTRRFVAGLGR